jgi:hypothetical protein
MISKLAMSPELNSRELNPRKLNSSLVRSRGPIFAVTCAAVLLCAASARAQDGDHAPDVVQGRVQDNQNNAEDRTLDQNQGQAHDVAEANPSDQIAVPDDIDWSLLNSDVTALPGKTPKDRAPAAGISRAHADWKRSDNDDGSSAVSVRRSLIPFWDAKIGADMSVASSPATSAQEVLTRKIDGTDPYAQSRGSAWAGMTAPGVGTIWDKTTIEARIDPSEDQTTFGTAISKSLPLGSGQYALIMQSGYSLIQQGNSPLASIAGQAGRNVAIDNSARLNVLGTGTSLMAGQTLSTADDRWLSHVGAEQKLFGGVSVTASVSETAEGYAERSLKAGYKYSW